MSRRSGKSTSRWPPRGPLSTASRASQLKRTLLANSLVWKDVDRCAELGDGNEVGSTGCVNALSWADDGSTLIAAGDDTRICMWKPDNDVAASPENPYPFKLDDTISTGHTQNIFSAKFLPGASHMTIASCAGDAQILVYDVERLDRLVTSGFRSRLGELNGREGAGVRKLLCHRDRVKRISTEDNPHIFLTVSEDGTVRQHDLRTTHNCRSACPPPLMTTLSSIQLYSLSVSKINPYLFTVAGTSPYAFLQDRRMVRPMKEEWATGGFVGGEADQGQKVHCVRRFGLDPNAEEEEDAAGEVEGMTDEERARRREATRRRRHMVRHITAVDMSDHNAEDLIVSFSGHSIGLFSIHDDPPETSIRSVRPRNSPTPAASNVGSKRRRGSSGASRLHRGGVERLASREPELEEPATQETRQEDGETASGNAEETSSQPASGTDGDARDEPATEPQRHVYGSGISVQDLMVSDDDDGGSDRPRNEGDPTHGDEGEGSDDEDDDMSADEEELEAILADEEDGLYPSEGTENSPFSTTPIVHPRRLYRGARNVETVKDVTFLGAEKNFIGSGSDDGNFFVWSKEGKLEGIWEGDSAVVNVIEQHPSLPLCAVSGIDSTVKLFAPLRKPPPVSFKRIQNAENIIRANTQSDRQRGLGGRMALLSSYARFLAANGGAGLVEVGDDGEGLRDCALQ
ncbi:hypothetical protein NCC49_004463 [Naganishia albida]|nr:hypothetical protein NCC49_004463 [Naganishia albida]